MTVPTRGLIVIWLSDTRIDGGVATNVGQLFPGIVVQLDPNTNAASLRVFTDQGDLLLDWVANDDTRTLPNSWSLPP